MTTIEHSIVIDRPVEEVFAYVSDWGKQADWQPDILESKVITEGPIGVGSKAQEVRQFLGRKMETIIEVTAYEKDKSFTIKSNEGPVAFEAVQTFERVEGGTKVSIHAEAETGGFFKLAEPLVARSVKKQFEEDFERLKKLLEAEG
ncbi:MAG: hypothetical protein GTO18_11890 [Anaerolineales bacterium]|nr:hypothetical protein [Anaerolineales bacterium]